MKFIIESGKMNELHKLLDVLVEEVTIDIDGEGWTIKAVDPAHVARLDLHIDARGFLVYGGEEERIALDLKRLKTMLANIPTSNTITIEGDANQLRFEAGFLKWRVRLDGDPSPISERPACEFRSKAEVKVEDLRLGLKAADTMAEYVELRVEGSVLTMLAKGDVEDLEMTLPIKETEMASGIYPLEHVYGALKAMPDGPLMVCFNDDEPLSLATTAWKNALQVEYMIAPRVGGGA